MTGLTRADLAALPSYVPGRTVPGAIKLASNEVSLPHFELVDTIAAMRWTNAEIPGLLRGLSTAMSEEMDAMAALDDQPALVGSLR